MSLQTGSLAHQIAQLETGETFSRTKMLGLTRPRLDEELRETKRKLRNHVNKHAERAAKETGGSYRLDCAVWLANEDAAVFVTVAITRII
jgi:hypothetical protein